MKRSLIHRHAWTLGLALLVLSSMSMSGPRGQAEDLISELELLRPFIGTWMGEFRDDAENPEVHTTWTPILDGQAVREAKTVPEAAGFAAEGTYYYDRQAGAISYLSVTNNGYVSRGRMAFDGELFVQTGTQIAPDSTVRSTRGTYRFRDDGTLVNEGGHVIVFRRR